MARVWERACHLRLGLATNGVNPFGLRSKKWSTWPIVLVNYNIPPWMSINKGHLVLSLLIPGKRKVKDMSVYLAPLIDELYNLWNGVQVVDNSSKGHRKIFNVRALLMWTMHDYLGYGDVVALFVIRHHAYPICGPSLQIKSSKHLCKALNMHPWWAQGPDIGSQKVKSVDNTRLAWSLGELWSR